MISNDHLKPVILLAYKINVAISPSEAWHLSVFVYDYEFSYGSDGLTIKKMNEEPDEAIVMGNTTVTNQRLANFLKCIEYEWTEDNYDVLTKNCHHFVVLILSYLGITRKVPTKYTELASKLRNMLGPMQILPGMFIQSSNNIYGNNGSDWTKISSSVAGTGKKGFFETLLSLSSTSGNLNSVMSLTPITYTKQNDDLNEFMQEAVKFKENQLKLNNEFKDSPNRYVRRMLRPIIKEVIDEPSVDSNRHSSVTSSNKKDLLSVHFVIEKKTIVDLFIISIIMIFSMSLYYFFLKNIEH